mmetsp:Transcript_87403/g.189286  ORF Transcript_87403/g.189286 Transcript_87403/m.189286 type:complete len:260 (+) Transcript_87403:106-885(+)
MGAGDPGAARRFARARARPAEGKSCRRLGRPCSLGRRATLGQAGRVRSFRQIMGGGIKKAGVGPSRCAQRDRHQGGDGRGRRAGPRTPGDELGGRGRGVGPARGCGRDRGGGVGCVLGEVLVAAGGPAGGAERGGRPRHREAEIRGLVQHAAAVRQVLRRHQAGKRLDVPADHELEEVLSAAGGEDVDGLGERVAHLRLARADAVWRHARDVREQARGVVADGVRRRREQRGERESHHACHGLEGWERRRKPGQGFYRA